MTLAQVCRGPNVVRPWPERGPKRYRPEEQTLGDQGGGSFVALGTKRSGLARACHRDGPRGAKGQRAKVIEGWPLAQTGESSLVPRGCLLQPPLSRKPLPAPKHARFGASAQPAQLGRTVAGGPVDTNRSFGIGTRKELINASTGTE